MLLAAALIFSTSMVTVNAETVETVETIETFEVGVVAETTTPVSFSPAIYKSGDEVSVKISADQNTGITILKFSVKFDPDALEFVDYTSANLFSNDNLPPPVRRIYMLYVSRPASGGKGGNEI